jgi:Oxidoreductase FAD-binding domain
VATVAHFNGPAWTPELAADGKAAYDLVARVMMSAAADDAGVRPAFREAAVIAHELRRFDIATFRVATAEPLHYLPGQSVSMECAERLRIWRFYSPANVPRDDLTIDFHVRMIDGGALSMVLTRGLAVGARLRIGSPVGTLTYEPGTGRDVLLVAGSTGLAPLRAIAEQISGLPDPPRVHLLFTGDARRRRDEVLSEAKAHAERVLDEAHSRASRAADEMASEPGPAAGGEWRDRTAELAYLRTFSEVYRTHLRAYLETLLNNVEDWEQSEKASLAAAGAELPFPFPPGTQGQAPPPAPGPTSYSSPPPGTSPYSSPPPGASPYSTPPPPPPSSPPPPPPSSSPPPPPSSSSPPSYSSPSPARLP